MVILRHLSVNLIDKDKPNSYSGGMKTSSSQPLEHIGAILPRALRTCQPEKINTFVTICSLWEDIVGKPISENVRPAAYKSTILIVYVNSTVWSHHLQFVKKELMDKINTVLQKTAVTDIRCKMGSV